MGEGWDPSCGVPGCPVKSGSAAYMAKHRAQPHSTCSCGLWVGPYWKMHVASLRTRGDTSDHVQLPALPRPEPEEPPVPDKTRLLVKTTERILVDVDSVSAERLDRAAKTDYLHVIEVAERFRRIAAYDIGNVRFDVSVTRATDSNVRDFEDAYVEPVDGERDEQLLWCARHFVDQARRELNQARHREGDVSEVDAVLADLGRIGDRLRVMALTTDSEVRTDA